jgi:hypothetical protein
VAFIGERFNFGEFKSKGLHKKDAVATWDLEMIRLFKQHFKRQDLHLRTHRVSIRKICPIMLRETIRALRAK